MSINPLNDITRVYLDQVVESSHLETNMEKRHEKNEKAIESMKKTKGYKDMASAARKKMEEATKPNDGNLANNYPPYDKVTRGDVIAGATGKDQMGGKKKKGVKEGYSNWRQDLSEVMTDVEDKKKIKEKKVENRVTINPKINEAVEEIGGTLLEVVELDEIDFVVESVYSELLEEGYDENDIEDALEYALTEAKVTFGHDTKEPESGASRLVRAVGRLARQKLSSKVREVKGAAKKAVVRGARAVASGASKLADKVEGGSEKKETTYRGAGVGRKEKVSSGSYTPPKAKTKKAAAPKAKPSTTPAPKRKRKSKLDDLLASVRSEEVKIDEALNPKLQAIEDKAKAEVAKRAESAKAEKEKRNRSASAFQAHKKEVLAKGGRPVDALDSWQKMKKEELELDEKLNLKKAEMGDVIRDFYKSKAPQFKGRSKEKRREMAIAAKLTAERGSRKLGEQMPDTSTTPDPAVDRKQEMLDKAKLANLKMLQQKQQMLQRQKLQMQKTGKLPLEASYQPEGEVVEAHRPPFGWKSYGPTDDDKKPTVKIPPEGVMQGGWLKKEKNKKN